MELRDEWFVLNERTTDLNNVLSFVEQLPQNIEQLFHDDTSNFNIFFDDEDFNRELFYRTYEEAHAVLFRDIDDVSNEGRTSEILGKIGFRGSSLRLKIKHLNKLWKDLIGRLRKTGSRIIDYTQRGTVILVRKFLHFLNSVLGSLAKLIPGADAFKEFKEIIENFVIVFED